MLCSDPCQIFLCSGHLQKGLFKGRLSLVESFFKQNYFHAFTRFAIFFLGTPLLFHEFSNIIDMIATIDYVGLVLESSREINSLVT